MPKLLPSFECPRAKRVRTGSALVIALLTRDRGVMRSTGALGEDTGGVCGSPPNEETGAFAPTEAPPGGRVSPKAERGDEPFDIGGLYIAPP